MPYVDLYSPFGELLYHSNEPEKRAKFLRELPREMPNRRVDLQYQALREAIEMIPEFSAEEDSLLAGHVYTLFAVTYPGWDKARPQNDAVGALRRRAGQIGMRVLEVGLQQ